MRDRTTVSPKAANVAKFETKNWMRIFLRNG